MVSHFLHLPLGAFPCALTAFIPEGGGRGWPPSPCKLSEQPSLTLSGGFPHDRGSHVFSSHSVLLSCCLCSPLHASLSSSEWGCFPRGFLAPCRAGAIQAPDINASELFSQLEQFGSNLCRSGVAPPQALPKHIRGPFSPPAVSIQKSALGDVIATWRSGAIPGPYFLVCIEIYMTPHSCSLG